MRRAALALCLSAILAGALAESTSACTIDGKPSAFAAGTRAVIARGAPTAATYAYWAIFAFPRAFRQGQRTGSTDACFAIDFCGFGCLRRAPAQQVAQAPK